MQFTIIDDFLSNEASDTLHRLIVSEKVVALDPLHKGVNEKKHLRV
jgi:hypothetical protein